MAIKYENGASNSDISAVTKNEAGNTVFTVSSGNKQLTVELTPTGHAKSNLDSIKGIPRSSGATTKLYTQALDWLQDQAAISEGSITYEMETGFTTMKKWLLTAGNEIFGWQSIYPKIDDPEKLIAVTTIRPKKR